MKTFDQIIDFTRASSATFVGSNGLIQSTPESRNLYTFTQQFDTSSWTKTFCQVVPNVNPVTASRGAELRRNFVTALLGTAPAATYNPTTGVGTAERLVASNFSYVVVPGVIPGRLYELNITNTGTNLISIRSNSPTAAASASILVGSTSIVYVSLGAGDPNLIVAPTTDNQAISFTINSVSEVIGGLVQAPDGTFTADTVLALPGTGIAPRLAQSPVVQAGQLYTASYFVRPGTHTFVQIVNSNNLNEWCNFTLSGNGSVQSNGASLGGITFDSSTGYYRISMTYVAGANTHAPSLALVPSGTASRLQSGNYLGTESVFVWGAQLELSNNVSLGEAIVTPENGPYDSAPAGVLGLGGGVLSINSGAVRLTSPGTLSTRLEISFPCQSNKLYAFDYVGNSNFGWVPSSFISIEPISGFTTVPSGQASGRFYVRATSTGTATFRLYPRTNINTIQQNGDFVEFTRMSVREVVGTSVPSQYTRNVGGRFPPRFDYDPVTREPLGLLIEGQRTNLLTQSEFANGLVDAPIRGGLVTAASFSGLLGSTGVAFGYDGSTASFAYKTNFTFNGNTQYTFSVFVRMTDGQAPVFSGISSDSPLNDFAIVMAGSVGLPATYTVTPFGGSLFRVSVTLITAESPISANTGVLKNIANSPRTFTVSGYQLEAAPFASSYIPTGASQVARTADTAVVTGANFTDWYRQDQGTVFVEAESRPSGNVAGLTDGTLNNRSNIAAASSGLVAAVVFGGVTQASFNAPPGGTLGVLSKRALAYRVNDFCYSQDGSIATDTSGTTPVVNRLVIGGLISSDLFGHIRRIRYWPQRLSNAQLQDITA